MYRHYHTEVYIGAEILFGTSFLLPHNPAGNYMFKVDSRTLEQGVKYVQMSLYEICLYC